MLRFQRQLDRKGPFWGAQKGVVRPLFLQNLVENINHATREKNAFFLMVDFLPHGFHGSKLTISGLLQLAPTLSENPLPQSSVLQ